MSRADHNQCCVTIVIHHHDLQRSTTDCTGDCQRSLMVSKSATFLLTRVSGLSGSITHLAASSLTSTVAFVLRLGGRTKSCS